MDATEELLRELSEVPGVSGYEVEVGRFVRQRLEPLGTIEMDRLGSVACRQGDSGPVVMLAAHMDEIGFMISHITDEGVLKFNQLGGWWDQVLLGQVVSVHTAKGELYGVLGAKPPHLLSQEERNKVVEKKDMYIDIGATSKQQALDAGVRPGDVAVPVAAFHALMGGKVYMGKAFDDRAGVALIIETLQHFAANPHPNTIFGAATVQEEVGLRGAKTVVELAHPDVAIILEVALCGDIPGIKPEESSVKLGKGPTIYLLDAQMIPSQSLRRLVMDTAEELGIPLQFSSLTGGATDGGAIHLHREGVPTIVIGVPTRHIHSHNGLMHRDDYDNTLRLLTALIAKLDATTVAGL